MEHPPPFDEKAFAAQFDLLPRLADVIDSLHSDSSGDSTVQHAAALSAQLVRCRELLREHAAADVDENLQRARVAELEAVLRNQRYARSLISHLVVFSYWHIDAALVSRCLRAHKPS